MFIKMKKGFSLMLAIAFLLISPQIFSLSVSASPIAVSIIELYTDKAAYTPDGIAKITINLQNNTEQDLQKLVTYTIYHLGDTVYQTTKSIYVPAEEIVTDTLMWSCPNIDFMGYLVEARLDNNEVKTTAIDVSSDFTRYPRYGYSVDFDVGETTTESCELAEELARDYHITAVQYYDWMWRHEKAVPNVGNTWEDMFGNTISKDSILQRINSGHEFNIHAMAYQMAYMAREGYEDYGVSKEWGLYRSENHNISYDPQDPSTMQQIYLLGLSKKSLCKQSNRMIFIFIQQFAKACKN